MKKSFAWIVVMIIANNSRGQQFDVFPSPANLPVVTEVKGLLFDKSGLHGYADDSVSDDRKNKLLSVIFMGSTIRLRSISNAGFYYKIFNEEGVEVTPSTYPARKTNPGRAYPNILLDTTLSIGYHLFADFYDKKTDTLLVSYYLKRLELFPTRIAADPYGAISMKPAAVNVIRFHKQGNYQKAPLLEYRIISATDTGSWKLSGNDIRLANLKGKATYKLQVRYVLQQERINTYTLQVGPNWYQTTVFYMGCGLGFLAGIVGIVWVFYRRKTIAVQQKQEALEQQIRIIQSQLNPHFVFNSLSSIQGMIHTNRIKEANIYLTEFSKLLRNTLTKSDKIYNRLDSEITILDTYLKLEQLRFGFFYSITTDEGINNAEIEIPSLLLQPIVENAVKHGVSALKEKGAITIRFFKKYQNLIAEIQDNGEDYNNSQHLGYGLKLTHDRISLINEMTGYEAIELSSGFSGGMQVQVKFNDWLGQR